MFKLKEEQGDIMRRIICESYKRKLGRDKITQYEKQS